MSKLTEIKDKIKQLEGGAFQELCDALLSRCGYRNIVGYGSQPGTQKTTPGNPDTYFITDTGKYVFVAYTTQPDGLFRKAKADIKKCLDAKKTGVETKDIEQIVFCHTSSRLSAGNDKALRDMCQDEGITLEIYGIDRIADELYRNHQILVRDILHISLDSGQIMEYEDFIRKHDSNKMAAPLDTRFQFRANESRQILEALNTNNAVVVTGPSGVGKTRLVLEVAMKYGQKNNYRVLCVRSMDMPIVEDLIAYLDAPRNYLIFVDDANELSNLKHILEYLLPSENGKRIKLIVTLRDYAANSVISCIKDYTTPHIINLSIFTDDEIKAILSDNMQITNPVYVDLIIRISEGNARMAYMAGQLAKSANGLGAIKNAEELYEHYYEGYLTDAAITVDRKLCMSAGLIALLHTVDLENLKALEQLLIRIGMEEQAFIDNIYRLHQWEFVDIELNRVAIISDQCLANYLLFLCFFKRKLISLVDLLEIGFFSFRPLLINSLNTIVHLYQTNDVREYLRYAVCLVWDRIRSNRHDLLGEYISVFHAFRPEEALVYTRDQIEQAVPVEIDVSAISFDDNKFEPEDIILGILSGYRDHELMPMALQLIFQYVAKCQDRTNAAYRCITSNYSVDPYSNNKDYCVERATVQAMEQAEQTPVMIRLYLAVAQHLCQLEFEPTVPGRKDEITLYRIPLTLSEGCKQYRKQIWERLAQLIQERMWQPCVVNLLERYPRSGHRADKDVVMFDQNYLILILERIDCFSRLKKALLFQKLETFWKRLDLPEPPIAAKIYAFDQWSVYLIFCKADWIPSDKRKQQEQAVQHCADSISHTQICSLVRCLNEIAAELDDRRIYRLRSSVELFITYISQDHQKLTACATAMIDYGCNLAIHPSFIINQLIELWGAEEVYQFIWSKNFLQQNEWQFWFFAMLSEHIVDLEWEQRFLNYISYGDRAMTTSGTRSLLFLKKYLNVDQEIFQKTTRIILEKAIYNQFKVEMYLAPFFNTPSYTPEEMLTHFQGDIELIKQIYFKLIQMGDNSWLIDYEGTFLSYFILKDFSWVQKYAEFYFARDYYHSSTEDSTYRLRPCWLLDNYTEVFDYFFNYIAYKEDKVSRLMRNIYSAFEAILLHEAGDERTAARQKEWILHCVRENAHDDKVIFLFRVLSGLSFSLRKEAVETFISCNSDFTLFERLQLESDSWSGMDSLIPAMQKDIDFLKSLLLVIPKNDLKYLNHRKYLSSRINNMNELIQQEELRELMNSRI